MTDPTKPSIDEQARLRSVAESATVDTWQLLQTAESVALRERRLHAYPDSSDRQDLTRIGLALSGGGIRSATFCLGLLRGLAENRVLRRLDYLSTVSGGGYIGAAFGRLVSMVGIGAAEDELRRTDSVVLTWLRRNGRYLTPAGVRDFGIAAATYLRAGVAVHFEIGMLAVLVGLLVGLPHLLLAGVDGLNPTAWQIWKTAWWPFALWSWLSFAPGAMIAYWPTRAIASASASANVAVAFSWRGLATLIGVSAIASAIALVQTIPYFSAPADGAAPPPTCALVFLATFGTLLRLIGLALRLRALRARKASDALVMQRNRLTIALRRINTVSLTMFVLGLVDVLTRAALAIDLGSWVTAGVGVGGIATMLVRAFAAPLQKISAAAEGPRTRWLPQMINLAGLAAGLLLLFAWIVLTQWLVFDENPWSAAEYLPPWSRALVVALCVGLWFGLTERNRETVNASSLHNFYRGRLTRAYISVGNRLRFRNPLRTTASRSIDDVASVIDVIDGDDIDLNAYQPEVQGGPIHLVCSCLNQTIDDRSDLYNADRKGAAIVASSRAIEVGLDAPTLTGAAMNSGTLARWIAISGAAAAPGAGSNTTSGWALLLFMAGARLGYWMEAALLGASPSLTIRARSRLHRVFAGLRESKPGLLASEALASFAGRASRWWFLSDGGHFDNTGVYALIRRELDVIVLADCGADPQFEFADIENMIRKARIDFDAEIEFYTQSQAGTMLGLTAAQLCVLSPEDMIDNRSARGVMLARICYRRSQPGPCRIGSLLIVKPNLHDALDSDLLAYARRNPSFPQQSTGDQFFDEAQWESYHRLGEDFGRALTPAWLAAIPGWNAAQSSETPPPTLGRPPLVPSAAPATSAVSFWRRGVATTALGTTLGIGAIGTLLLPGWQAIDSIRQGHVADAARDTAEKKRITHDLGDIEPRISPTLAPLESRLGVEASTASSPPTADIAERDGWALAEVYRDSQAFRADDPDLAVVETFLARVKRVCVPATGQTGSTIPAPRLCGAVADAVSEGTPDPYWTHQQTHDENWRSNPIVAFVLQALPGRFAPTARTSTTDIASTAPTEVAPTADTPTPVDQPVTPALPTAPSVSEPQAAPSSATLSSCDTGGDPLTLYVQIYDESLRAQLENFYARNKSPFVRVAGIENVTRTAQQRGTRTPELWRGPTLILHRSDAGDLACANALAGVLQSEFKTYYTTTNDALISIRSLPAAYASHRHVMELWVPPARVRQE